MRVAPAIWLASAITLIVCASSRVIDAADAGCNTAQNAAPRFIEVADNGTNGGTVRRCPPRRVVKRCLPATRSRVVHGSASARYTPPPPPPPPLSVLRDPAPTVSRHAVPRTVRSGRALRAPARTTSRPVSRPISRPVVRSPRTVRSASRMPAPPPPPSLNLSRTAPRTVSRPASRPAPRTRIAGTPVPPPATASRAFTPVPRPAVASARPATRVVTRPASRPAVRPAAKPVRRTGGGLIGGSGRPTRDGVGLNTLRFLDKKTGGSGCLGGT